MDGMSTPEMIGFGIFIVMTVVFFVWVAYVAFSK